MNWRAGLRVAGVLFGGMLATATVVYIWFPRLLVDEFARLDRHAARFARHEILTPSGIVPYLEAGRGPTVLLLHGLEDSKDSWVDFATHLTDGYHVVIPDLHAFGENHASSNGDYRPPAQALRMHQFLVALHIDAAHIAGVSMGGEIAGAYAAQFPAATLTLALMSAAGGISDTNTGLYRGLLRGDNVFHITDAASVDTLFALIGDSGLAIPGFVKRAMVAEAHARGAQWDSVVQQLGEPAMLKLTDSLAPGIATRTLVLWGLADSIFHVSIARRLAGRLPHAELAVLPDCGHLCVGMQAAESGERYRRFLDQR